MLLDGSGGDGPVPLVLAIGFALILGYGLAMLWWLIHQTKGQIKETFRPTLGRIVGAFCLAMVTPIVVFSYLPWIIGSLPIMALAAGVRGIGYAILLLIVPTLIAYPFAAMIVRHTYRRRWLRFGLFALFFWSVYAAHLLFSGAMVFRV